MTALALPRQRYSAWRDKLRSIQLGLGARGALGLGLGRSGVSAAGNGLLNNLVAYWKLDEAGGANDALDAHTNGLTLTQVSSPGADTGKVYATARTVDGGADYFHRASEALLQTGNVDFTIAAWVYATLLSSTMAIVTKDTTSTGGREYSVQYHGTPNTFRLAVSNNGTSVTTVDSTVFGTPNINTWYLVVAWHDAVNDFIGVQCNGAATTKSYSSGVFTGSSNFRVGAFDGLGSARWNGRIGPVMMWKSAAGGGGVLSAAQRTALFNGGAGLPYSQFTT